MDKKDKNRESDDFFFLSKHDIESASKVRVVYQLFKRRQTDIIFLQRNELWECSRSIVSRHPDLVYGYIIGVSNLLANRSFEQAQNYIQQAINSKIEASLLLHQTIQVCNNISAFDESFRYGELLLKHYPEYWQGYKALAQAQHQLGRIKDSKETILEGIRRSPRPSSVKKVAAINASRLNNAFALSPAGVIDAIVATFLICSDGFLIAFDRY